MNVFASLFTIASDNITLASSSPPAIKAPTLVRLNCYYSRSNLSIPSRVSVLVLTPKKWIGYEAKLDLVRSWSVFFEYRSRSISAPLIVMFLPFFSSPCRLILRSFGV